MRFNIVLIAIFCSINAFAQGGAMGGGGGDGLQSRLNTARAIAIKALQIITPEILDQESYPQTVKTFYRDNRATLIEEIQFSKIVIRPQSEVVAQVGGILTPRKAMTGFYKKADILFSLEANFSSTVEELTEILIHESGHHTGYHDENENQNLPYGHSLFLDQFAASIAKEAKKRISFSGMPTATADQSSLLSYIDVGSRIEFLSRVNELQTDKFKNEPSYPGETSSFEAIVLNNGKILSRGEFQQANDQTRNTTHCTVTAYGNFTPGKYLVSNYSFMFLKTGMSKMLPGASSSPFNNATFTLTNEQQTQNIASITCEFSMERALNSKLSKIQDFNDVLDGFVSMDPIDVLLVSPSETPEVSTRTLSKKDAFSLKVNRAIDLKPWAPILVYNPGNGPKCELRSDEELSLVPGSTLPSKKQYFTYNGRQNLKKIFEYQGKEVVLSCDNILPDDESLRQAFKEIENFLTNPSYKLKKETLIAIKNPIHPVAKLPIMSSKWSYYGHFSHWEGICKSLGYERNLVGSEIETESHYDVKNVDVVAVGPGGSIIYQGKGNPLLGITCVKLEDQQ